MIEIENLSFGYSGRGVVFEDMNLTLPSGHIYGLLGRNGAGKSTLLKLMAGLLFPDKGNIKVAGFRPEDRFPQFLQEIYFVPEEFELPAVNTERFVSIYSPFYPRFNYQLFDQYISEFQVSRQQKLSLLSLGQKKKFLLSFGLATDCSLLILDEPTNGLDIPSKSKFRKIVANAIHEDRSFVISTHQVRDMENLIDPVIILEEGQIVFFRDYEQISQKISISRQTSVPGQNVLYFEPTLGGYTVVKENEEYEETRLNLEVLFNAVIASREKIEKVFNN